jgi:FkbM family methyltransferase
MNVSELEAANRATLKSLSEKPGVAHGDSTVRPYYGYYDVNLFECPPFVMFTGNDCPRANDILYHRHFEPQSMKLWCRLARTATGILDVGAHVGTYSLAAAALRPDLLIHAFEPNPHAYTRLRMHKIVNRFNNIVEHWFAAGDKDELVKFSWVKKASLQISSGGGVGSRKRKDVEEIVVPMARLDGSGLAAALGDRPIAKIDVEGGEIAAVAGMNEIIARRPDIILETFQQDSCDAINATILPLGYRVYRVREHEGRIEPRDRLEPSDLHGQDFNQFLTTRPHEEIEALLRAPALTTPAGRTSP